MTREPRTDRHRGASFLSDLVWNYASFAVVAGCGLVINLVIAVGYDAAALGRFNVALAVFIIGSQLGIGAVQYSVLHHVSSAREHGEDVSIIVVSGSILATIGGVVVGGVIIALSPWLAALFDSPRLEPALLLVGLAIPFFCLNKTLLAGLNALLRMRAYAIAQTIRALVLVSSIVVSTLTASPAEQLTIAFLVSEITLFAFLGFAYRESSVRAFTIMPKWFRKHLRFSVRGYLTGVLAEANTRVDVLVLGYFASDHLVGLYSFAAMFAEGFYQLLVVVKARVNPLLATITQLELRRLLRRTMLIIYPVGAFVAVVIFAVVWVGVHFEIPRAGYKESLPILAILLALFWTISAYVPFDAILNQRGKPGWQSTYHVVVVLSNVVLNVWLIPSFGMAGAAIATGASYIIGVAFIRRCARTQTGFVLAP